MRLRSDADLIEAVTAPADVRAQRIGLWTLFAALVMLCLWRVEFNPSEFARGLKQLGWLVSLMLPPDSGGYFLEFSAALVETVMMALLGAALATLAAFPLSLLAARATSPWVPLRFAMRRLFDVIRGVDKLIWALIFVAATGLGPFAGVMALAVGESGVLGKLFADALDDSDARIADSVRATGGSRVQVLRFALLPQSLPVMVGLSIYYFEMNVRSAAILGIVGAGGIGFELADRIRVNEWQQVGFLILMIFAVVALVDRISGVVTKRIVRGE